MTDENHAHIGLGKEFAGGQRWSMDGVYKHGDKGDGPALAGGGLV
jgi:hypothetical protein